MDDAVSVRVLERVGDLQSVPQRAIDGQAGLSDERAERLPLNVLHDDEWPIVTVADFVNRADVRMVQRGGVLRFAQQPTSPVLVGRARPGELERNGAAEPRIARAVDDTHATRPDGGEDLVRAD